MFRPTPVYTSQPTLADQENTTSKPEAWPTVFPIPRDRVAEFLPQAKVYLDRVLNRPDSQDSMDSLAASLISGDKQAWLAYLPNTHNSLALSGVAVSEVLVSERLKTLWVLYLAGDRVIEWGDGILEVLEAWGRELGCDCIEFRGRHGWMVHVPQRGYKDVARIFRKPL